MIEESDRQTGELSKPEREMLANLLKFGDLRVKDVMVPRADIVAMDEATTIPEFVSLIGEVQHSRLPIYRETLDNATGLVHIKDVLRFIEPRPGGDFHWHEGPISQFRREILVAPPSMPLLDLLLKMQTAHIHLALVIDEYGGTDGLVSIEDIIEEIVGDISDEHDEEPQTAREVEPGPLARRCAYRPGRLSRAERHRAGAGRRRPGSRYAGRPCRVAGRPRAAAR